MAAELQSPVAELSLNGDISWDSFEDQLGVIEPEAIFDQADAPGAATGSIGTVTVTPVYGSAVGRYGNAERAYPVAETSIVGEEGWHAFEGQLDGIEREAIFLGRVDATASGGIGTVVVTGIEGTAEGSAPPPPPPPEELDLWGWWTRDPKIQWVWDLSDKARARADEEVILCG